MSKPAIAVEDLSKSYFIGQEAKQFPTFREAMVHVLKKPLRRLRNPGTDGASVGDGVFRALQNVDFQVRPGEVIGIVGRNGAGKSTLLKVLSRITEPASGCGVAWPRFWRWAPGSTPS